MGQVINLKERIQEAKDQKQAELVGDLLHLQVQQSRKIAKLALKVCMFPAIMLLWTLAMTLDAVGIYQDDDEEDDESIIRY